MDILYEAKNLLDAAGYHTCHISEKEWLIFEDEALFGFICLAQKVSDVLEVWEKAQDSFLMRNSVRLREFPLKAWNAYSVFLTEAECPTNLKADLLRIEEDFRGTRKIVQTEISSIDELYAALFPLLPIKNLVSLKEVDSTPRLESRLSFLRPNELEALKKVDLSKQDPSAAIVDILLGDE